METQTQHPVPADRGKQAPYLTRNTRGALCTLTLIAFLAYDLTYFAVFLNALLGPDGFEPQILGSAIVLLLLAGVVATRWRWAPLFGAAVSLVTGLFVFLQPHSINVLTHVIQPEFTIIVLSVACALVALIAGVGATVQNIRVGTGGKE
jgi:hypothetical protein